jgi:hypothetical protein
VSVSCPEKITGLVDDYRRMFSRVDRLSAFPARPDLASNARHAGVGFLLVVECGNHDMPPLPPLRVIAVMADDEALDAVIFGIHLGHSSTVPRPLQAISAISAELALALQPAHGAA